MCYARHSFPTSLSCLYKTLGHTSAMVGSTPSGPWSVMLLLSNTSSTGDFHPQGQHYRVHNGHLRGLPGTVPYHDSAPVPSLLWVTWTQPAPQNGWENHFLAEAHEAQLEPSVPCTRWPRQLTLPSSQLPRASHWPLWAEGCQAAGSLSFMDEDGYRSGWRRVPVLVLRPMASNLCGNGLKVWSPDQLPSLQASVPAQL